MPSIAHQTTDQLGGSASVLARQRHDHAELDRLLERLQATSGDAQDDVLTRIWRLVFRHAYAEETVLFPVLRRALADGEELTAQVEREHQEVNEIASALDARRGDRGELVQRLVALLREDVRDEEDVLLPRLQEAVDAQQLRRLGRTWELVRRTAPTRPHAVVSRRPPGNVLAAIPLAVLDHARDGLDVAARRSPAPLRGGLQAGSRALAAVAGLVEHAPPLQWGERAQTRAPRTAVQA